jgi:hypothetical protein
MIHIRIFLTEGVPAMKDFDVKFVRNVILLMLI